MKSNPLIGLDLPMKMLAWQDANGKVRLGYTQPGDLKLRYAIGDRDDAFKVMKAVLADLAKAPTGGRLDLWSCCSADLHFVRCSKNAGLG
jgi:Domain of unknown function DUF302